MAMISPRTAKLALRVVLVALSTGLAAGPNSASGEEHGAGAETAAAAESPSRTDILDLGSFRIRGSQFVDHEVTDIRLGAYLVLSSKVTPRDFHELERWKNRLRDQAIIAVRSAGASDFAEPGLRRLQRLMLFRMKRLPVGAKIIGVNFTDFTFDHGQTLEDEAAPLIIPPKEPEKKPAEGGGH